MKTQTLLLAALLTATLFPFAAPSRAQAPADPAIQIALQRDAMQSLSFMDGAWRGQARTTSADGNSHEVTQTERIGPLLDGSIRLIEGRGYNADGSIGFNAFAVLSYDPETRAYNFRSHAMGRSGDFVFTPHENGYAWEIPAGPMTIRYTATIGDGVWHEVGDRIMPGKPPVHFFEMTLHRIGDSDWPGAGEIAAE